MKIFGIGLPKTGTSSLHEALKVLGFNSVHFPHDKTTVKQLRNGDYRLSLLEKADALSDIPVPAIYPQLDHYYPDSKFILTVRNMNSWLDSCRNAPFNQAESTPRPGSMRDFYRTLLYGCSKFSEHRFRWVYETHHRLVGEYFSGEKARQLLILDVTQDGQWERLCSFLKVDVPRGREFPHQNKRKNNDRSPLKRAVRYVKYQLRHP